MAPRWGLVFLELLSSVFLSHVRVGPGSSCDRKTHFVYIMAWTHTLIDMGGEQIPWESDRALVE